MAGSISSKDRRDPELSSMLEDDTLDPAMHYRFFQVRPGRIAQARAKGYRKVSREEDGVRTLFDHDEDDGTDAIVHGDRVLMQIPKEEFERGRQRVKQLTEGRLTASDSRFREKAKQSGIRVAESSLGREPEE